MDTELRVLIVEDSEMDAELIVMRLEIEGYNPAWQRVDTRQTFLEALNEDLDIILSDWTLPQFSGLAALRLLKEKDLDIPFIIISGSIGEEAALDALRLGAYDYILKDRPDRLGQAVHNALEQKQLRDQHRQAQESLAKSEAELRALFASMEDIVLVLDKEGVYRKIAPTNTGMLVQPRNELIDAKLHDFFPEEQEQHFLRVIAEVLDSGNSQRIEYELEIEGITRWFETTVSLMTNELVIWVARDVTERKKSEIALLESEQRYTALFKDNQSVILITDPETGIIQDANAAAAEFYGWSIDQLKGMNLSAINLIPSDQLQQALRDRATEKKVVFHSTHLLKDESIREVEIFGGPIQLDEKKLIYSIVHDITERLQGEKSRQEHAKQQERIIALGSELSATIDEAVIYPTVERYLQPMIGYQTFAISTLKEGILRAAYVRDEGETRAVDDMQDLQYGPEVARCGMVKAITTGLPVIVSHANLAYQDCNGRISRHPQDVRSAMFIPMVAEGRVIGCLEFFSKTEAFYTEEETKWLYIIANLVGLNILNAWSFENSQKRLAELGALHTIDMAVTSSYDQTNTFEVLLQQTTESLGVDAAAILLINEDHLTLEYSYRYGFLSSDGLENKFQIDECLAGEVVRKAEIAQYLDLAGIDPQKLSRLGCDEENFIAYIGAPLVLDGHVIGVLEILNRTVLRPDKAWLRFLELITGQAAIAVSHSNLIHEIQSANKELLQAYDATIEGWSQAMDLRDKETEGHTQRVSNLGMQLAERVGLRNDEIVQFKRGALLHDMGKLGVPDQILLKTGALSAQEWVIMKQHPVFAYQMLSSIEYLKPALDIPYCHHEKWDGSGYPRGLQGEQIPIAARIFSLADVYDALTSDRPYRPAWTHEAALDYIRQESGKHFDPNIVPIFIELIKERDAVLGAGG